MSALARFVIFACLVLETLYLITFKFNFLRLGIVLMVLGALFSNLSRLQSSTKSLMFWVYLLVVFRFVVDMAIQNDGTFEALTQLVKEIAIVSILPLFEFVKDKKINIRKSILWFVVPSYVLGVLQIFSSSFTVPSLIPLNPVILTEGFTQSYLAAEQRIVGTFSTAIGFALTLGFVVIIFWSKIAVVGMRKGYLSLLMIIFCSVLILFSQTRSAIYGLVPAIFLALIFENPKAIKRHAKVIGVAFGLVFAFGTITTLVSSVSERSGLQEMDSNTYLKITANLYGTYAAIKENPLIGTTNYSDPIASHNNYKELIEEGKSDLGVLIEHEYQDRLAPTNHNLFAYYLRYYGIIGFILLMIVCYKLFDKARMKADPVNRYLCIAALFYFLQYSMLHNTMLMETGLLWVIMAIGSEGVTRRRRRRRNVNKVGMQSDV